MDDYVNTRLQTSLIKCWVYGDYKTECNTHCHFTDGPLWICMEVLGCVCQQECLHNSAIAQNFQISLQFMPAARSLRHIFVPVYVIQHKCKQAPQKTSSVKASLVQNSLLFLFANLPTASPVFMRHMLLHNQSYNPAASMALDLMQRIMQARSELPNVWEIWKHDELVYSEHFGVAFSTSYEPVLGTSVWKHFKGKLFASAEWASVMLRSRTNIPALLGPQIRSKSLVFNFPQPLVMYFYLMLQLDNFLN